MLINKKIITGLLGTAIGTNLIFISLGKKAKHYKIFVNYNGQADLLLSLQIFPDYYPYQFKQKNFYEYLTNDKYLVANEYTGEKKQKIKDNFYKRLNKLIGKISEFGPSLWNKDLYDTGVVYRNDQFWNKKNVDYLFLEQFIMDDFTHPNEGINSLPKYKELHITNYRVSRDPYTVFGKETFDFFKNKKNGTTNTSNSFYEKLHAYYKHYDKTSINSIYRFSKFIDFWNDHFTNFQNNSNIKIAKNNESLFDLTNKENDRFLANLYVENVFSEEEIKLFNKWEQNWKPEYLKQTNTQQMINSTAKNHHPALEHSTVKGSAPLAEGAQKDIIIYMHQFANVLSKIKDGDLFQKVFKNDERKTFLENVNKNASEISKNYYERITNIRDYFKSIGVIDSNYDPSSNNFQNTNSKSLAIVTYPPNSGGEGDASIQTISKFPFIYIDLGFKQIFPNINETNIDEKKKKYEEVFSVDDNGWWWNIGNTNLSKGKIDMFKSKADSVIFLATNEDWNLLNSDKNPKLNAIYQLVKKESREKFNSKRINKENFKFMKNTYSLWNEGLRSPIAINLVLDQIIEIITKQYQPTISKQNIEKYKKSQEWGNYWEECFINEKTLT